MTHLPGQPFLIPETARAGLTHLASSEQWEQSFNALTDEILILNKAGEILWGNRAAMTRFEPVHGPIIGLDYRLLYYGTTTPSESPPWESVLAGALSASVEVWLPKCEGWFSVSCYPLKNTKDVQWGVISVVKNITERKRVEEALRCIAQGAPAKGAVPFFRTLIQDLSSALDVEYSILAEFPHPSHQDAQTLAVYDHGQFTENFQWSLVEGSLGRSIMARHHCTWGSDVAQQFPFEPLLQRWPIHSYIGSPLINSLGQVVGLMVGFSEKPLRSIALAESILPVFAVRAATELERIRAEVALRDNEARYRAIAENAYDMIVETTTDGTPLYVSPSCQTVLGYPLEDLITSNLFDFLHPDERPSIREQFTHHAQQVEDWQLECRIRHQTNEWRWFESHIQPYRTAKGQIVMVIVSRDITERRRLEEERLRATKLESIGTLAGGIAHDFNNILTAIFANIGLAKMLSAKPRPDSEHTVTERLGAAEKACLRARDLTKQLLTFAKGGAPVKNPASITRFIHDTAEFALRGSNVRCELQLPESLWSVEVDEGQMSQVIQNLIINADQAMPEGGIITILAENVSLDSSEHLPLPVGPYVKIMVTDQGGGIPQENLSKIFDPYFTTKPKGSGLGLATTYSIIKGHEGHITVASEVGVGTTFTLYLPASRQNLPNPQPEKSDVFSGSGRILVMDDEDDIREVLGKMLTHLGYQVDFANDGTEAYSLYQSALRSNYPYAAIIMDLTIPGGLGGKETIRLMKAIDPSVIALVSSGYSNDPVMANPGQFGFKAVVTKPYNLSDLTKALRQALPGETTPLSQ